MWLPTPVYERVPQFYFLCGLLFIADGLFLGFEIVSSFYYVGLGFVCCTYGLGIFFMRMQYRQAKSTSEATASGVDEAAVETPAEVEEPAVASDTVYGKASHEHSVQH